MEYVPDQIKAVVLRLYDSSALSIKSAQEFSRLMDLIPDHIKAEALPQFLMSDIAEIHLWTSVVELFSEKDREEHFVTIKDLVLRIKAKPFTESELKVICKQIESFPLERRLAEAKAMTAPAE